MARIGFLWGAPGSVDLGFRVQGLKMRATDKDPRPSISMVNINVNPYNPPCNAGVHFIFHVLFHWII